MDYLTFSCFFFVSCCSRVNFVQFSIVLGWKLISLYPIDDDKLDLQQLIISSPHCINLTVLPTHAYAVKCKTRNWLNLLTALILGSYICIKSIIHWLLTGLFYLPACLLDEESLTDERDLP